jgi:negative regulator of flagellin synthesis FlgM
MTDAISPSPRPVQTDNGARKSAGKSEKSASLMSTAQAATPSVAPPVAAPKTENIDEINLRKVAQRMHEEPNFDRKKVDSIRRAIEDGQYPLDPKRIAESFLAIEQMIKS